MVCQEYQVPDLGRRGGSRQTDGESSIETYTLYTLSRVEQIASERGRELRPALCDNQRRGIGWRVGETLKREGKYVYLLLIWQKPTYLK